MPTTRVALLELLSELMEDWWSQVTTAAGSTTTTVDTKLAQLSDDDDFCLGWYIRKVATDEVRRISAYTASSTTITHAAFPLAIGSGNTYELHRIDPTLKHNALLRATERAFPNLYLPLRNETLAVDNLLANWDFETFSSGFTSWTETGSPTVTAEASRVWHGSQAAKVVSAAGAAGRLEQDLFTSVNLTEVVGKTFHVEGRIWASAGSVARLGIRYDASNYKYGAWHGGKDEWEGPATLYVERDIAADDTALVAVCEVATGTKTAYFDSVVAWVSPVYKYTIPTAFIRGPHYVSMQHRKGEANGAYFPLGQGEQPVAGHILRLEGMGLLTAPTTDAGTIEVVAPRTELLLAHAMAWLTRAGILKRGQKQRQRLQEDSAGWEREIARLEARPGMALSPMSAEIPKAWHVEQDSAGRYLVFHGVR